MPTIQRFSVNDPRALGSVYLQPPENVPPTETLFVVEVPKYGITLVDSEGVRVTPKSPRLGFNGRRGTALYSIVCEDGMDPQLLIDAGYSNVVERG